MDLHFSHVCKHKLKRLWSKFRQEELGIFFKRESKLKLYLVLAIKLKKKIMEV